MYIKNELDYIPRNDLDIKTKNGNSEFEMKWMEIIEEKDKNKILGTIYRHPTNKDIDFNIALSNLLQKIVKENKEIIIAGDLVIQKMKE